MKTFHINSLQRGFTLIELMIAMLIGVFLMGGVIQIFLSAKQAYRLQENLSRLQENGRFAMDFITKDVRMAGFIGCSKTLPVPVGTVTELTKISGKDSIASNWNSTAVCGGNNECIATTDAISFQYAKSCGGQLTASMLSSALNTSIKIGANSCSINNNDRLLIADCATSDVFTATGTTNTTVNGKVTATDVKSTTVLSKPYLTDAELFRFESSLSYYIRKGAGDRPALWRFDGSVANELIEGIENMQILYGVDTDTPNQDFIPNYYVDSTKVTGLAPIPTNVKDSAGVVTLDPNFPAWGRVVSVRISLLAATIDDGLTFSTKTDGTETSQPYTYNGTTTTPTDRRIRRVFSSTIAVRNRLP